MATNTSEQALDITAQMQAMIKSVDMMIDKAAESVAEIVNEGSEMIASEQKRLISGKSAKLAALIKPREMRIAKNSGNLIAYIGYDTEAIKEAPESVVIEFGRPGKQRGGKDSKGRKIGKMEAVPHIRKGFDLSKDKAAEMAVSKLDEVVKEWSK